MKKTFSVLLFMLTFLLSCSPNKGDVPIILVDSVYVGDVKISHLDTLLQQGDRVKVYVTLSSVGTSTLVSFLVQTDEKGFATSITGHRKDDVSSTFKEGDATLRFKDGIHTTQAEVTTLIQSPDAEEKEFKIKLYLNTDDKGEKHELEFDLK